MQGVSLPIQYFPESNQGSPVPSERLRKQSWAFSVGGTHLFSIPFLPHTLREAPLSCMWWGPQSMGLYVKDSPYPSSGHQERGGDFTRLLLSCAGKEESWDQNSLIHCLGKG